MKLIKLSEEHYVVVDDTEIKEGDWCYRDTNIVLQVTQELLDYYSSIKSTSKHKAYKITHSTQPIEFGWGQEGRDIVSKKVYDKVKPISLSEVKELFSEDTDVWSRKLEYLKKVNENIKHKSQDERIWIFGASDLGFTAGYNQALEDNRGKKYTKEDMQWALHHAKYHQELTIEQIIEALHQPKTEWDVEFSNGKLKLVQQ